MTVEFTHNYNVHGVKSECVIKVYSDDGEHFMLFENIGIGVSVTNASEQLAEEIVAQLNLNPHDCRFFETYQEYDYETLDEIEYTWSHQIESNGTYKWHASNAIWSPANQFKTLFLG